MTLIVEPLQLLDIALQLEDIAKNTCNLLSSWHTARALMTV